MQNREMIYIKNKLLKFFLCLLIIDFILILFINANSSIKGVSQGLTLCAAVLIPSLFPFMVATNFISYSGIGVFFAKPIGKISHFLFNIPKQFSYIVILSLIGGYPVGASLVSDLCKQNLIDKKTATRIMCFCINAGPAMIVFTVGNSIYNSIVVGFILWGCHIAASMIIGVITGLFSKKTIEKEFILCKPKDCIDSFVLSIENASKTLLIICGFVVFFSCIINLLQDKIKGLSLLLEVTTACKLIAENNLSIYLTAFLLGFGGISVIFQVYSISNRAINFFALVLSRVAHGILSVLLLKLYMLVTNQTVSVISNGIKAKPIAFMFSLPFTLSLIGIAVTFLLFTANSSKN